MKGVFLLWQSEQQQKNDWKTFDMPELHDTFILDRLIDEKQMSVLEKGNIPQGMEDKWFWYMEALLCQT